MLVDSYRFLPRSFLALYQNAAPLPDEAEPVWAPFESRLADATVALLTSAGLSLEDDHEPFDVDRERAEPSWGDPTFRELPHQLGGRALTMSHLHVNNTDVNADRNVALPVDVLDGLIEDGLVRAASARHFSVMGYQQAGLEQWRNVTAPAIIERLREDGADGVVLAPV